MTMRSEPTVKDDLKAAFAAAGRTATVEVYPADHGWCVKGSAVYDEAASRTRLGRAAGDVQGRSWS
jgi:dienelactone hydrolase